MNFAVPARAGLRAIVATVLWTLDFRPHPPLPYPVALLIAFNKPCGVLSCFTPDGSPNRTLAEFGFPRDVYPLGRLDADSEGLLLLTDEARLNQALLHPKNAHRREYWAQVERVPSQEGLLKLGEGLAIQARQTLPCRAWILKPQPEVPPRDPPIRFRTTVPTCWIGLELTEGRNRQVRRMTAAIGHPTLRLIRMRIGGFGLRDLAPGAWRILSAAERNLVLAARAAPKGVRTEAR
jgi:23S rRNA pseudouridine2457 synthase